MKEDVFVFGPSAVAQLVWDVGKKSNKKKRGVSNFRGKKKGGKTPWLITCSRKQEKEKSLRTSAKVVRKNMIDRGVTENMAVNMIE